jgi:hypothetical protein
MKTMLKKLPYFGVLFILVVVSCSNHAAQSRRASITEATQLVRAEIFKHNPDMNPAAQFPLEERTTDEVWQRTGVQVFQIIGGVHCGAIYLIEDSRVELLSTASSWSICRDELNIHVVDLDSNGEPELAYTYESGSGVSYSHVAVYSSEWPEPVKVVTIFNLSTGRIFIDKRGDQDLRLEMLFYELVEDELRIASTLSLGSVFLERTNGQPRLVVELERELPPRVWLLPND